MTTVATVAAVFALLWNLWNTVALIRIEQHAGELLYSQRRDLDELRARLELLSRETNEKPKTGRTMWGD